MSLSAHEQQELDLIEDEIAGSDPALATLLATFARLAADEELPAREQIRVARHPHGRRGPPVPGTFRCRSPAMRPGLVAVLLWLTVSIALIISVLVISRGGGGKGCAVQGITCAGQAPAHGLYPGTATPPASQAQDAPGQLFAP